MATHDWSRRSSNMFSVSSSTSYMVPPPLLDSICHVGAADMVNNSSNVRFGWAGKVQLDDQYNRRQSVVIGTVHSVRMPSVQYRHNPLRYWNGRHCWMSIGNRFEVHVNIDPVEKRARMT